MAKNKKEEQEEYDKLLVTELLPYAMERYAGAVILDRAIPDIRDGLKPVHRRLLYTMHENNTGSKSKHTKLAKISGLVLGYHPHNSMAISDAAVLLSQQWVQSVPLIEIEGNNGSIDGDMHAADRYIEARLTPESEYLLRGLNQNSVDFKPTYDNESTEPVVLPAEWPVLFTNGAMGIAVGFATNIPPHNPVELIKGAELINRKPETTLSGVMRKVKGPDFPTGGIIMGRDGVVESYKTGKGTFVVRGRVEIENGNIVITELPYDLRKKDMVEDIVKVIDREELLPFVKDIIDESKGVGVRVVIELEKNADAQMILNVLYKKSKLQQNFSSNFVTIHDGTPIQVGLVEYLNIFLDYKKEVTKRRFAHEWEQRVKRLEIVEGFIRLYDIAEEVVAKIKESNGKQHAIKLLETEFKFTERQATAIAEMPLYRMSNQDEIKLVDEKKSLNDRLSQLRIFATDDESFRAEISKQLLETAEMFSGHKRKTDLREEVEEIVIDHSQLIEERDVVVVVKPTGVQRMSETVYENNKDKYKETVIGVHYAQTTDKIVLFTRGGEVMQRTVDELEHTSIIHEPEDLSRAVKTFKSTDEIMYSRTYNDEELDDLRVFSLTKYGQAKKHPLSTSLFSFNNKGYLSRSRTYNGLKLKDDEVIHLQVGTNVELDTQEFKLQRKSGGHIFEESPRTLNEQGTAGSGTNWVKINKDNDEMLIIEHRE